MDKRRLSGNVSAVIVALMMLLTAHGDAWVMLAVAGLLLVGLLALYRDDAVREGALPAAAVRASGLPAHFADLLESAGIGQ